MKKLFTLLFVSFLYSAQAHNYYFSAATGDDSRSSAQAQSPNTAWKTLGKLNTFFSSLQPGDSVLLKRGDTFYGSIIAKKSGTSSAPIVIGAYGAGNKPVITSLVSLSTWVSKGNGIYESSDAALSTKVTVVIIDGVEQELGRYPNSDAVNKGYLYFESHDSKASITDNQLTSSTNWTGADLVLRPTRWVLGRGVITSHSGTKISYKASTSYEPKNNYGYFFTNSIKTLDKFGEWYYDSTTRKMNIYFGSNVPSSYTVQVPVISDLIHSEKFSYLIFDNLNIKGATASAVNIRYGSHIYLTNCDINFSGENGIKSFYHTYLKVEGCTISNSNYGGINMGYNGADNAIIRNNKIINTSIFPGMAQNGDQAGLGIMSYSNNCLIEYNEIRKTGFNGITFNGQYVTVKNNYIDSFCLIKDDGAGIYVYNGGSANVLPGRKVIGNIIINGIGARDGAYTPWETPAEGIYMDEGTSYVEVKGNSIANCTNQGIYFHNSHDITVTSNTIFTANSKYLSMLQSANKPLIRNNTISGNIFFATLAAQSLLYLKADLTTDLTQFGNFSGNYYARPADNNTATVLSKVRIYESAATIKSYTTAIRFEYNTTTIAKTIVLDANYADVKNNQYTGSITLQPFTSAVLIRTGNSTNIPSTVSITSPAANATFAAPPSITISATAADSDGTIKKVEFYNGTALIGTDSTSPYSITWNNATAGNYSITAKATDNGSLVTTSAAVAITVLASNIAPSISLTSPVANSTFASSASITMSAGAKDADGKIYNVKFYIGTTYLKTVLTSPYTYTISNVAPGNYTITAKATDNNGLQTISAPVTITVYAPNVAPAVSITSPVTNASFAQPASVTISATAADSDGTIKKVEFYNGTALIGTDSTSPYSITWNNATAGNYSITAKATDNGSFVTTSAVVAISVYKPNVAPTVSITSPVANATFTVPASITISATAIDTNGTIRKVEFYSSDTLLGTDTTSPYSFTWNNVPAGNYTITAKATDNDSLAAASAAVAFSVHSVNLAPSVRFTGIATNFIFGSLPSVAMTAAAADADGAISKVGFYNADTLIGTVTSSPYTFTWNDVQSGIYTITAKATDNNGAVTASSKVTISVVAPIIGLKSMHKTHSVVLYKPDSAAQEVAKPLDIKVFPNPAVSYIRINIDGLFKNDQKATLNIQNLSGIILKSIPVNVSDKIIEADVSSLSAGMYIVSITSNKHVTSSKFIKN